MKFLRFLKYSLQQILKSVSDRFLFVFYITKTLASNFSLVRMYLSRSHRLRRKVEPGKIKVLFVTEKWCDCNPSLGITNSEHNLFNSLKSSELAVADFFHFDDYYSKYGNAGDPVFLGKCLQTMPDVMIVTWWPGTDSYFSPYNPKISTLAIARFILNIPIVTIWYDSADRRIMQMAEMIVPFTNLNVVVDSSTAYLQYTRTPKKYFALWTPQDPSLFFNPFTDRKIEVSFVGSTCEYPDRLHFLSALKHSGIDVYVDGGQREHRLSVEEYAKVFQESKIVLNFSRGRKSAQYQQLKGRVFEATLSGALLMEQDNVETQKWFIPNVDYIPFSNEFDLVQKVHFYLCNPQEREVVAGNGYHKASTKYTAKAFWESVFHAIDL